MSEYNLIRYELEENPESTKITVNEGALNKYCGQCLNSKKRGMLICGELV